MPLRLVSVLFLWSCASSPSTGWSSSTCAQYDAGTQTGTISDADLSEASGLAASHLNPGIFWTHNDSGNSATLFALTRDGTVVSRYEISGATNIDFEDIALGPCPEACSCLFVADMGDNLHVRPTKTVYRFAEPVVGAGGDRTESVASLTFSYPDGARPDAETLFVDPRDGIPYVVTKNGESGLSEVYRFPTSTPSGAVTLTLVASLDLNLLPVTNLYVTGGDMSADGARVVIRTLAEALEYTVPAGATVGEAFEGDPRIIPLPAASQGEAIAYASDGMSLMLVSENLPAPMHQVLCVQGAPVQDFPVALETDCASESGCRVSATHPRAAGVLLAPLSGLVVIWGRRRSRDDSARHRAARA